MHGGSWRLCTGDILTSAWRRAQHLNQWPAAPDSLNDTMHDSCKILPHRDGLVRSLFVRGLVRRLFGVSSFSQELFESGVAPECVKLRFHFDEEEGVRTFAIRSF